MTRNESAQIQVIKDLLEHHQAHEERRWAEFREQQNILRQEMRDGFAQQDGRLVEVEKKVARQTGGRAVLTWIGGAFLTIGSIIAALISPWKL